MRTPESVVVERRIVEALAIGDQVDPQRALAALLWVTASLIVNSYATPPADPHLTAESFGEALLDIVSSHLAKRERLQ